MSVGFWLESECGWFSYKNTEHCEKQLERVKKEVADYKDHPAVLAWGIGNEAEGDGGDPAFWKQIEKLVQATKALDPARRVLGLYQLL